MTSGYGEAPTPIRVLVDGLRVHCLTAGLEGPPVLLLHGGGLDSASLSYKYAIGPLARGHRVFAPDWPGYGESEDRGVDHTMEFYTGFVGRLMESLTLERASLVGLSLGGGAALGFALRSPVRVDKLVLVDSYGLGGDVPWGRFGYLLVHAPLIQDLTYALLRRSHRMVRRSLYGVVYDRGVVSEGMVEEAYRLVYRPRAGRAFAAFQRKEVGWGGLRTNYVDRLQEISAPTLVVHSAHDAAVPVSWARKAQRLIAGSELRVLPECGHWPPRERPEEFNRIVAEFLAR